MPEADLPASSEQDAGAKRSATLRARFALVGFELHALDGGRWLLGRWGRHRELRDLDEVERVLEQFEPQRGVA